MAAFVRSLNIADNDIFVGLSSDTKPTVSPGALAYETNTGLWYIMNLAGSWVVYTAPVSSAQASVAIGPPGDAVTNSAAIGQYSNSVMTAFNGTSLDRWRNNVATTLLASASRTTTQVSADIPTYNFKALTVILDMTVVAASPSVTVTINGKDPASGKYYLLLSGAAVLTAVTNVYSVGPGIAASANVSVSSFLPAIIQIVVTANNANAGTYSVGTNLMI